MVASAGLVRLAEERDHTKIVEWIRRTRRSFTKISRDYPTSEEQPLECVSHHIIFHTSELFPNLQDDPQDDIVYATLDAFDG
jgi:hypothetical protein